MISGKNQGRTGLGARLASFFRDRNGHYGTITALIMAPLLAMASSSLDLVRALNAREQLQQAADAAALDAVAVENWGRYVMPGADESALNKAARKKIEASFRAQVSGPDAASLTLRVVPRVSMVGRQLRSSLTYEAEMPTTFMKIIGMPTMRFTGTANATSVTPRFTNITFLVDNSPSMGIAADFKAMDRLGEATKNIDKCTFACHTADMPDTYVLAKALNIPVRLDTVKQALNRLADTMKETRFSPQQYLSTLYTLGPDAIYHSTRVIARVGDISGGIEAFRAAIGRFDLMYMNSENFNARRNTNMPDALNEINKLIPSPGDGKSPATPEQLLILISDGLSNTGRLDCGMTVVYARNLPSCQEPVPTKFCDAIKARGIRIATLYTTFLPMTGDQWYRKTIQSFQDKIPIGMRDCASPGLFFEVGFNDSMDDAINALFNKAVNTPRLLD